MNFNLIINKNKFNEFIIPTILENGEQNIPLIGLLESLEILNVLEIMLIVALIILLFNKNIYNLNIKIISYILNKYIPDNYHNKINTFLNKGTEYNKIYINILIVLIITILLILKLGNLYITSELYSKVDDYVLVYNYLKKNNILLILSFNNKLLNKTFYQSKSFSKHRLMFTMNNKLKTKLSQNPTLGFLESIKELINSPNLDTRKTQAYIESEWLNIVKKSISDGKYLHNNLGKAIKFTQETVSLTKYSRRVKNIIPILKDSIENIEYLIITFSIVVTYYHRMGYTAIAQLVGNQILYIYYKKEYINYMKQNNMDDELNKSIDSKENNDTITPFPHWIQFKSKNEITDRKLIILGDYFLTCFIISDIFYKEFKSDTRESDVSMIKINSKYLEDIKKNIFVSPFTLPMICEPEKWSNSQFGGFIENKYIKNDIVLSTSSHKHKMSLLPTKIIKFYIKSLKFFKKSGFIIIIYLLILLLISNLYSTYYLNFFICNLDNIIDIYFKK